MSQLNYLHVFGMITNAVYHLVGLDLTCANSVDCSEEWELVFHVLALQHVVDFLSSDWTLCRVGSE